MLINEEKNPTIVVEDKRTEVVDNPEIDSNEDYISTIIEMKKNTVPKSEYDKLREQNKKLIQSLSRGETIEVETPKSKADINKMREELFNNEYSNLEYTERMLSFRKELIAQGYEDPFVPNGKNIQPTNEDIEKANNVATVLQECVDYAEGNSEVFTAELNRRMIDSAPMRPSRGIRR